MNHHLRPRHQSSPVRTLPRPMGRKLHVRTSGDGGDNAQPDRVTCAVCGFAGNPITVSPGANFPTTYTTVGSTYSWTSPAEAITTMDKEVIPVPAVGASCAFCGSTRLLGGSRGSGNAV